MEEPKHKLDWLVTEPLVLTVIGLNGLALVLAGFPAVRETTGQWLGWVDYGCLLYFLFEAIIKIRRDTFAGYWARGWNKMDFFIVMGSSPLLLQPFIAGDVGFFSIILVGRFLRLLRIMYFVPNSEQIWAGIIRALKASAAVFLTLAVLNMVLAMGANTLFGELAPQYFGDPVKSAYSLFKVFTIEGWYEIPDALAASGLDSATVMLVRGYFVLAVLVGGILGLSLANAVFVDEMTADNNDRLEQMVSDLREELADNQKSGAADRAEQWKALQNRLDSIQKQLTEMRGS